MKAESLLSQTAYQCFSFYTRTLSLETVHTTFERNCQMVAVSRIWCGIANEQF